MGEPTNRAKMGKKERLGGNDLLSANVRGWSPKARKTPLEHGRLGLGKKEGGKKKRYFTYGKRGHRTWEVPAHFFFVVQIREDGKGHTYKTCLSVRLRQEVEGDLTEFALSNKT